MFLAAAHPEVWHTYLAWAMLALGFASAIVILVDELVLGHRQHMFVMNLVHPITALYWGPVWVWAYLTRGRRMSMKVLERRARELADEGVDPRALDDQAAATDRRNLWHWHVANAVSHCGAGCTLGDILGEWVVFMYGISWFGMWSGHRLPEELLLDFVAAWALGVLFQYFTIVPMRGEGRLRGVWSAIKVDTASIVSFQVGLFGWMAIFMLLIWPHGGIQVDTPDFWFQMQIGMILGYLTAWGVNRRLVTARVKEKMDYRRPLAMLLQQEYDTRARNAGRVVAPPQT
jgi:hypothetical protein